MFRPCLLVIASCGLLLVAACTPSTPPDTGNLRAVTAVPTLDTGDPVMLCDLLASHYGRDWPQVIRALEALFALDATCGDGPTIARQLYTAYLAYGTQLEQQGHVDAAQRAYEQALRYNFNGPEALARLDALAADNANPQPFTCDADQVAVLLRDLPDYVPVASEFISIAEDGFRLSGRPYNVYGMNYNPRDYPEQRFLTQMDVAAITPELELLHEAGLNTLRISLRHDALFTCPGNGAVPVLEGFARLDAFIHAAAARGFRLILVLNHSADLLRIPLYEQPAFITAQMRFVAERYRHEAAIMAYDLRSRGDHDYTNGPFARDAILNWLAESAMRIREAAPQQLITAGWDDDSAATAPIVDFVSFQHHGDLDALRQEIANLRAATTRPLLLASLGYTTWERDEIGQRLAYQRALDAVRQNGLAGWIIAAAFDHPLTALCVEPDCPAEDSAAHHAGLWDTAYFPKLALNVVRQAAGVTGD